MSTAKNLFKKMMNILEDQRKYVNSLSFSNHSITTELYRTKGFVEQLEGIIKKLIGLFMTYEDINKTPSGNFRKTKEYSLLINNIMAELQYLKATSEVMDDNLDKIKKSEHIQFHISGKIIGLKKQINKTIKKAEDIINN